MKEGRVNSPVSRLYGYGTSDSGELVIVLEQAEIVKQMPCRGNACGTGESEISITQRITIRPLLTVSLMKPSRCCFDAETRTMYSTLRKPHRWEADSSAPDAAMVFGGKNPVADLYLPV